MIKIALAGMSLALAFTIEHTAAIPALAILAWGVWTQRAMPLLQTRDFFLIGLIGGLLGAIPLITYNLLVFGNVFQVGYQSVEGFEGMQQGFMGVTLPRPFVMFILLFSDYRGLFAFAPILLVSVLAIYKMSITPERRALASFMLFDRSLLSAAQRILRILGWRKHNRSASHDRCLWFPRFHPGKRFTDPKLYSPVAYMGIADPVGRHKCDYRFNINLLTGQQIPSLDGMDTSAI